MMVGYSGGWVSWSRVSKGIEYPGGRVYPQKGHGTRDTLFSRRNIVPEIPYALERTWDQRYPISMFTIQYVN